jgi:hypothetical protein
VVLPPCYLLPPSAAGPSIAGAVRRRQIPSDRGTSAFWRIDTRAQLAFHCLVTMIPPPLCEPHLQRTGRKVASTRSVGDEWFCSDCFAGRQISHKNQAFEPDSDSPARFRGKPRIRARSGARRDLELLRSRGARGAPRTIVPFTIPKLISRSY